MSPARTPTPLRRKTRTTGGHGSSDLSATYRPRSGTPSNSWSPGLDIIDGGTERSVASGFIDITAKATDGSTVVIELKAGTARRDAIGQILSYMGDIAAEESNQVRGILVAAGFDDKARSAARVVSSLSLRRYRVSFEFFLAEDAAS